jgi:predicted SnoaL-like aldol condensation-catalyzing enzyme
MFVDIWRVADGKIAEHWDVIQDMPRSMPHANGMACGRGDDYASARMLGDTVAHPVCGDPGPSANREASLAVLDAYFKAVTAGSLRAAVERFFAPGYRQHSPTIPDGAEGAIDYLENEFGKGPSAMPKAGPARIVADGNFVLYHRLVTYAGRDRLSSNIDIFRIENGRIAEHWDVKQAVPEHSANDNGMW